MKFVLISFLLLAIQTISGQKQYNGHKVVRLFPDSVNQLRWLHNLTEKEVKYDFWTYPTSLNKPVDVRLAPDDFKEFEKFLFEKKIKRTMMIDNVQRIIDEQKFEAKINTKKPAFFDDYQRLDKVNEFIASIAKENPELGVVESIGKSYENRDMKILRLGIDKNKDKPAVWLDGGIHAREWISPATVAWIIQELVDGYKSGDAEIKSLLEKFEWYFLVVSNPDGYEYTHTNERLWRKTRSKRSGSSCYGVDPNRNFGFKWNQGGASTNPCSETYCGPKAFSERETSAMRDAIWNIRDRVKLYIAFHSYSQLWLYPWGWTSELTPDDEKLKAKSIVAVKALTDVNGAEYDYGTSTNVLYVASGGADDWAYGGANITYSYTVELRDTGYYGFTLPKRFIEPSGIETFAAVKAIVKAISDDLN